jgi:chemotaxis protein histidine kinase CheA
MTASSAWDTHPKTVEHETHAVIEPVNTLAERAVRGGMPKDVERQIAQAEESLAKLRQEFPAWMATEFEGIETAWDYYKSGAGDGQKVLFRKVHDMRGQAATFGFPLAGRAADNLCKLMDALQKVPDDIIEAHIQTIRVIIREQVNIEDHPLGVAMVRSLEGLGDGIIKKALANKQG